MALCWKAGWWGKPLHHHYYHHLRLLLLLLHHLHLHLLLQKGLNNTVIACKLTLPRIDSEHLHQCINTVVWFIGECVSMSSNEGERWVLSLLQGSSKRSSSWRSLFCFFGSFSSDSWSWRLRSSISSTTSDFATIWAWNLFAVQTGGRQVTLPVSFLRFARLLNLQQIKFAFCLLSGYDLKWCWLSSSHSPPLMGRISPIKSGIKVSSCSEKPHPLAFPFFQLQLLVFFFALVLDTCNGWEGFFGVLAALVVSSVGSSSSEDVKRRFVWVAWVGGWVAWDCCHSWMPLSKLMGQEWWWRKYSTRLHSIFLPFAVSFFIHFCWYCTC